MPFAKVYPSVMHRVLANVRRVHTQPLDPRAVGPCWLWKCHCAGGHAGARHPRITLRDGGVHRSVYVHRWMVEQAHRCTLTREQQVDHLCEQPACINPAHLEVVTGAENRRRSWARWEQRAASAATFEPEAA